MNKWMTIHRKRTKTHCRSRSHIMIMPLVHWAGPVGNLRRWQRRWRLNVSLAGAAQCTHHDTHDCRDGACNQPCGYETATPVTALNRHPRQQGDIISGATNTRGRCFVFSPRDALCERQAFLCKRYTLVKLHTVNWWCHLVFIWALMHIYIKTKIKIQEWISDQEGRR